MSALAGWIKSKKGIPLGKICSAFETAEKFYTVAGKHNIRDQDGKSRLALACYGLSGAYVSDNEFTRVFASPLPGWAWVRGWLNGKLGVIERTKKMETE